MRAQRAEVRRDSDGDGRRRAPRSSRRRELAEPPVPSRDFVPPARRRGPRRGPRRSGRAGDRLARSPGARARAPTRTTSALDPGSLQPRSGGAPASPERRNGRHADRRRAHADVSSSGPPRSPAASREGRTRWRRQGTTAATVRQGTPERTRTVFAAFEWLKAHQSPGRARGTATASRRTARAALRRRRQRGARRRGHGPRATRVPRRGRGRTSRARTAAP